MSHDRTPDVVCRPGDIDPLLLRYGRMGAWARVARERDQQLLDMRIRRATPGPPESVDRVLPAESELG
jgi:hypothetical protein